MTWSTLTNDILKFGKAYARRHGGVYPTARDVAMTVDITPHLASVKLSVLREAGLWPLTRWDWRK